MADVTIFELANYSSEKFKKYLNMIPIPKLRKIKESLDKMYYNPEDDVESPLSDDQYDQLKDILLERDPTYVSKIGASLTGDEGTKKVKLPFHLGSMDKFKPDNAKELNKWMKDYKNSKYMIEDKLDGISGLLMIEKGEYKLYTRGDGTIGENISNLIPHLSSIPKNINVDLAVRGELIMDTNVFNKHYKGQYKSARNFVAARARFPFERVGGVEQPDKVRPGVSDIKFIVYEQVGDHIMDAPKTQLDYLDNLGFEVVRHQIIDKISIDILQKTLIKFRETAKFAIDGIIVQANDKYIRNTSGNPEYAFAFKMNMTSKEVEVIEVIWNISKWGDLKPTIRFEKTDFGEAELQLTTGFNAKFIESYKIGPGTILCVERSGDVIPNIARTEDGEMKIVKSTYAQMPTINYAWSASGVNIHITEYHIEMCIRRISDFLDTLGVKGVGIGRVRKLVLDGNLNTLIKVISATKEEIKSIDGFAGKTGDIVYDAMHKSFKKVKIETLLDASGVLGKGIGKEKIESVLNIFPDIIERSDQISQYELYQMIMSIDGFAETTAIKIAVNLPWAKKFLNMVSKYMTFYTFEKVGSDMDNMNILFSGVRANEELTAEILSRGGKIASSMSKKVTLLIVKEEAAKKHGKSKKAMELGIPIMLYSDFIDKYSLKV